ncbi:amino acid ABC transporter substrate-binding protein, PAAT family [Albimonas pacifica]|uniref:Amino acid ABC transporter substrate-binding protein, PAAT family n=1 Tax=Albimonas pacifica TaxID=1114924 RepID=A0A1I3IH14_9RHOB|nr:amino acid ABC transporter substrate-binding protein, PAAT family [Albimonas pacifica]
MPRRRSAPATFAAAAAWVLLLLPDPAAARCEDWTPQARPQNASRDVVGQSLDDIQARGWIDIAVYEDFPPWSWEEDGEPMGVDVALGRIIAESLGVAPRFTFVTAGETLDDDLRNHVWKGPVVNGRASNVMLHVPYDSDYACRVEQVVFTGRYFDTHLAIAYRRDAYPEDPPVPAYFRFDTVAVENDSLADFHLSSIGAGMLRANIRRYPSTPAAMQALARGETKAAMGPLHELEWGLTSGLAVHSPPLPGLSRGAWTLGAAVRHSWRPLAYAVGDAVTAAVEDGRLAAIFEAHGLSWTPPAD